MVNEKPAVMVTDSSGLIGYAVCDFLAKEGLPEPTNRSQHPSVGLQPASKPGPPATITALQPDSPGTTTSQSKQRSGQFRRGRGAHIEVIRYPRADRLGLRLDGAFELAG